MVNFPFDTNITDLKPGQRFYKGGMWYDFVSYEQKIGYIKIHATNGYDERQFTLIAHSTDKVAASKIAQ